MKFVRIVRLAVTAVVLAAGVILGLGVDVAGAQATWYTTAGVRFSTTPSVAGRPVAPLGLSATGCENVIGYNTFGIVYSNVAPTGGVIVNKRDVEPKVPHTFEYYTAWTAWQRLPACVIVTKGANTPRPEVPA